MTTTPQPSEPSDGAAGRLLLQPRFLIYLAARFSAYLAIQIASVSVGWLVYEQTRNPLMLGLVGLVQFAPALLLVPVTGFAADRWPRQTIMAICNLLEMSAVLFILFWALSGFTTMWPVFFALLAFGVARAFFGPAVQSLMANVVRTEDLPTAISWSTGGWQAVTIVGPVAGGLVYGLGAAPAFLSAAALFLCASIFALFTKPVVSVGQASIKFDSKVVLEGLRYVRQNPVVLGAMTLDLFVVLLGGAVALLPVVALDLLEAGPVMLGALRAAPGVGGVAIAIYLGLRPLRSGTGRILFLSVLLFGAATVALGLSQSAWLSLLALVLIGGADMVSVYIRSSIIQLATPDAVRGRVSALNMVFVGASNELGEFRAGLLAHAVGPVAAIATGGFCSILIAFLWLGRFPTLFRVRALSEVLLAREASGPLERRPA